MSGNSNFMDLMSTRHSTRAFKNTPIPEDKINTVMDWATRGPSAGNLQSYQIFLVFKESEKEKLAESAHDQNYVSEAPLTMVFCSDPKRCSSEYGSRGETLFSIQDATISCVYAQIAAHSLGLSSVWIGSFDEKKIFDILGLSNNLRPIAILPIGFPDEEPEVTNRRPLSEIFQRV